MPSIHLKSAFETMSTYIDATFVDGVLKPDERLDLVEGTRVRLRVETKDDGPEQAGPAAAQAELDRVCDAFPIRSSKRRMTRDELHERR